MARKTNLDKWTHDLKRSVAEAHGRGYLTPSAFCILFDDKIKETLIVTIPLVDFKRDILKVREFCANEACIAVCLVTAPSEKMDILVVVETTLDYTFHCGCVADNGILNWQVDTIFKDSDEADDLLSFIDRDIN